MNHADGWEQSGRSTRRRKVFFRCVPGEGQNGPALAPRGNAGVRGLHLTARGREGDGDMEGLSTAFRQGFSAKGRRPNVARRPGARCRPATQQKGHAAIRRAGAVTAEGREDRGYDRLKSRIRLAVTASRQVARGPCGRDVPGCEGRWSCLLGVIPAGAAEARARRVRIQRGSA